MKTEPLVWNNAPKLQGKTVINWSDLNTGWTASFGLKWIQLEAMQMIVDLNTERSQTLAVFNQMRSSCSGTTSSHFSSPAALKSTFSPALMMMTAACCDSLRYHIYGFTRPSMDGERVKQLDWMKEERREKNRIKRRTRGLWEKEKNGIKVKKTRGNIKGLCFNLIRLQICFNVCFNWKPLLTQCCNLPFNVNFPLLGNVSAGRVEAASND